MRLPAFLLRPLACWLIAMGKRRPPNFIIGGEENPYLLRWYLIPRNRWFNIYLHCFVRSDDDRALHDHPWPNLSLLLDGFYDEIVPADCADPSGRTFAKHRQPGQIVLRRATAAHRVVLFSNVNGIPKIVWSLFLTGPAQRDWGFWCPQRRFVHWKDFTSFHTTGKGDRVGPGCDAP